MIKLFLLAVLLSGVAVFAHVQQRSPINHTMLAFGPDRQNQPSIWADMTFVDTAAKGGIYGLLLAIVGVERGRDPGVKAFAETLIQENQAINSELTSIAQV